MQIVRSSKFSGFGKPINMCWRDPKSRKPRGPGFTFHVNFYPPLQIHSPFIQILFSLFFCYVNSRKATLPGTRWLGTS